MYLEGLLGRGVGAGGEDRQRRTFGSLLDGRLTAGTGTLAKVEGGRDKMITYIVLHDTVTPASKDQHHST